MAPVAAIVAKLKVHLKLSISRLRIVQQKDQALAKQQRRAMAQLLEQGKHESARIRVENIIRSDLTTELHEILELYCELLLARINLLLTDFVPSHSPSSSSTTTNPSSSSTTSTTSSSQTTTPSPIDPGLSEAVKSLLYAAPRTDVKELHTTRALLVERFGKDFAAKVAATGEGVPERVLRKLRVEPPGQELVESYLKAIAGAYDVAYGEDEEGEEGEGDGQQGDEGDDDGEGGGAGIAVEGNTTASKETPLLSSTATPTKKPLTATSTTTTNNTPTPPKPPTSLSPKSPVSIAPPSPSTDNANPKVRLGGATALNPRPLELRPGSKLKGGNVNGGRNEGAGGAGAGGGANVVGGDIPDVDDLEKRFALLKK